MNEPKLEIEQDYDAEFYNDGSLVVFEGCDIKAVIPPAAIPVVRKHLNEGMEERFVVQPGDTEPGYATKYEARSCADYMFSPPWRIVRILVPAEPVEGGNG